VSAAGDGAPGDEVTAASKFLAYVLRHDPGAVGLELGEGGWVAVTALAEAAARHGRPLTVALVHQAAAAPGKRRFELRDGLIRAAQGHSVPVDLGLAPAQPPAVLYHGTVARFLPAIRELGLLPGARVHVHLSAGERAAAVVGARRGRPVVLRVDAAGLAAAGHEFFRAANGVWLTAAVPPAFLVFPGSSGGEDGPGPPG
jgi:putative RNA 2'-phosphotransferase